MKRYSAGAHVREQVIVLCVVDHPTCAEQNTISESVKM
jgi:hypothetical protein